MGAEVTKVEQVQKGAGAREEQSDKLDEHRLPANGPDGRQPIQPDVRPDNKQDSKQLEAVGALPKLELCTAAGAQIEVPRVEEADFAKKSLEMFDRIDNDGDGFLSDRELSSAMQNRSFTDQDAQIVTGLYKGREGLSLLDRDDDRDFNPYVMMIQGPKEPRGVSKTDLLMYAQVQPGMRETFNSSGTALSYFNDKERLNKADSNGDGQLTRKEILDASAATEDQSERRALSYMASNFDTIRGASTVFGSSTISKADMTYHHKQLHKTDAGKAVSEVMDGIARTHEIQKDTKVSRDLYGNSDDPLNSITPDAVRQQTIGNCYFEASLASLAHSRPQDIQKMIKDNGDGTYTVTFPGDPDSPVTVSAPTDGELGLYNRGTEHGVWANVIEKAFGQYRKDQRWIDKGDRETPTNGGDGGGPNAEAMFLLTGKDCGAQNVWIRSDANLQTQIKEALNDSPPRMVCVGSYGDSDDEDLETGYAGNHAYSVTGYREDENGNVFITVRNPWGGEGKSGTSEISMEDFRKTFSHINVEPKS